MKKIKKLLSFLLVIVTLIFISGCGITKINFDLQNGSEIDSISIKDLQLIDELETPTKLGYNFKGWFYANDLDKPAYLSDLKALKTSVTLIAKWEAINYKINYENLADVSHNNPLTYNLESNEIVLTNPELRPGYEFLGWFIDPNYTTQITKINKGSINEITIYAKWTNLSLDYHHVTFDLNNVEAGSIKSQTVQSGSYANRPKDPELKGYEFVGWTLDKSTNLVFDFLNTTIDHDITLYAVWKTINKPIILGVKNIDYIRGDAKPNLLFNVTAFDDIDGEILVNVLFDEKNFDIVGEHLITYSATNSRGYVTKVVAVITVYQFILVENPVIEGAKDLYYVIGDMLPDLSDGVFAYAGELDLDLVIDDSNVNYLEPGIYYIIYQASNIDKTTTVKVSIEVIEANKSETFVETFDNISNNSSSYSSGSFIGNNNIKWNYEGMRTDLTFNGKALTFSNKSVNDKLSANISGGISSFSFKARPEFSGSDNRLVSLVINGDIIKTFSVNSKEETYSIENINISGDFTLEIVNTGKERVTIDDITWTSLSLDKDENDVEIDYQILNLNLIYMTETTIFFPSTGTRNTNIDWSFKTIDNPNNNLIDFFTGNILVPSDGQVEVEIQAVISKGKFQKIKSFKFVLGEGDPITIQAAKTQTETIKTKGIITGIYLEKNKKIVFLEDSSAAIQLRFSIDIPINIGDELVIRGQISNQNGNLIIDNPTILSKASTSLITPTNITANNLINNDAMLVKFKGLVNKDYTSGNLSLVTKEGIINVINKSSKNPFKNLTLGVEVEIIGHIVKEGMSHLIWVLDDNNVEIFSYNQELLLEYLFDNLNLKTNMTVSNEIILNVFDISFTDITISWESDNQDVISNSGKVTQQPNQTSVTLTYTYHYGLNVIGSGQITVNVLAKSELMSYYQGAEGLTGNQLKDKLSQIISANNKLISYSSTSAILAKSDESLEKPGYLYLIYDGQTNYKNVWTGGSDWNKEHIWPQSKLGGANKADMHNLRASTNSVNSSRGNLAFVDGSGSYGKVGSGWYPGDDHIGDIARAVLYMHVRWGLNISSSVIGNLDMFIRWHEADPVSEFEIHRNQIIFETQNNRNPFVDNPEFVSLIWGNNSKSYNNDSYNPYQNQIIYADINNKNRYFIN